MVPDAGESNSNAPLSSGILTTTLLNFTASPSTVYVGQEVNFFANASSDVSSELTFAIYYDSRLSDWATNNTDSPFEVVTTASPGMMHTSWTYNELGNISGATSSYVVVTLYVGDGTHTYKATRNVYIIENTAPKFLIAPGASVTDAVRDEPYNLAVKITDADDDPVHVTWDFGDGSPTATNDTGPAQLGVYANQTHTWSFELDPGVGEVTVYFTLNITLDDGQGHRTTRFSTVSFFVGYNFQLENITLMASADTADPQEAVTFSASATDWEGDAITWTYVFNDTVSDYHTEVLQTERSEPNEVVWANATHVFGTVGTYTVRLYAVDAIDPELVLSRNQSTEVTIEVAENNAPVVSKNISIVSPLGDIILKAGEDFVEVCFSIGVIDADEDILTVRWDFGDGSEIETSQSSGETAIRFYAFHNYSQSGIYNVTAKITDGRIAEEIVRYKVITVRLENLPPAFKSLELDMSYPTFAEPDTDVGFIIVLNDREHDMLTVTFDFGDNSSLMILTTSDFDTSGNVTVTVFHRYNISAEYTVVVTYSDNIMGTGTAHNKSLEILVRVRPLLVQEVRIWNWWDFVSLGLVLGGIGCVVGWTMLVGRFRKTLDMYGMTLDEFRIHRKETKDSYKRRIADAPRTERSRLTKEMRAKTSELNRMLWHRPELADGEVIVSEEAR